MAHDVFLSYSSNDSNAALAVLHGLEAAGVRCWMAPRDIKPGAIWAQSIMEGIIGCRVLVVVFSASSNRSSHVINEVDAAVRKGAVIIPFRIEDVMPDGAMEYHLRTRHWLDALTPDVERHTEQLAEQIRMLLEANLPPAAAPTPPPRLRPDDLPPRPVKRAAPAPRNWPTRRRMATIASVAIPVMLLAGWLVTRRRPVHDVDFTVHEVSTRGGNEASLRVTTGPMRFFESGREIPLPSGRSYAASFAAAGSRYVNVEVPLRHEAAGRAVAVALACNVHGTEDQVVTTLALNSRTQPSDTITHPAIGWGSPQGGGWKAGRYMVECRYGDDLVARDWFEVTDGGSAPSGGGGPLAVRPELAAIGARVSAMRFFEGDGRNAPAIGDRNYQTSFDANTARFIYTEVTMSQRAPGAVVRTQLNCRYLRNRTEEIGRRALPFTIQPAWVSTYNELWWGRNTAGWWVPGEYLVACDDGSRTLGQAGFTVR